MNIYSLRVYIYIYICSFYFFLNLFNVLYMCSISFAKGIAFENFFWSQLFFRLETFLLSSTGYVYPLPAFNSEVR